MENKKISLWKINVKSNYGEDTLYGTTPEECQANAGEFKKWGEIHFAGKFSREEAKKLLKETDMSVAYVAESNADELFALYE